MNTINTELPCYDSLKCMDSSLTENCSQLIVVFNDSTSSKTATLIAFEKKITNGISGSSWIWEPVDGLYFNANIGHKGFAKPGEKKEGDRKTPSGAFSITHYFSIDSNNITNLNRIPITKNTIWVDDPKDSLYNTVYEQKPRAKKKRRGSNKAI